MTTTIDYLLSQQTYDYASLIVPTCYVFDVFFIYQSVEPMELATCKGCLHVPYQEPVYA